MRAVLDFQFPTNRVYPAATLDDGNGGLWSLGEADLSRKIARDYWVLRNGIRTNGHGLELWSGRGFIWTKSPKDLRWYKTTDAKTWVDMGPNDPALPVLGGVTPGRAAITGVFPEPSDSVQVQTA